MQFFIYIYNIMINQQFKNKYLKYKNKYYNLINKHKKLKGGSASEIVMGLSGILLILGIIILFITGKDKELIPKEILFTTSKEETLEEQLDTAIKAAKKVKTAAEEAKTTAEEAKAKAAASTKEAEELQEAEEKLTAATTELTEATTELTTELTKAEDKLERLTTELIKAEDKLEKLKKKEEEAEIEEKIEKQMNALKTATQEVTEVTQKLKQIKKNIYAATEKLEQVKKDTAAAAAAAATAKVKADDAATPGTDAATPAAAAATSGPAAAATPGNTSKEELKESRDALLELLKTIISNQMEENESKIKEYIRELLKEIPNKEIIEIITNKIYNNCLNEDKKKTIDNYLKNESLTDIDPNRVAFNILGEESKFSENVLYPHIKNIINEIKEDVQYLLEVIRGQELTLTYENKTKNLNSKSEKVEIYNLFDDSEYTTLHTIVLVFSKELGKNFNWRGNMLGWELSPTPSSSTPGEYVPPPPGSPLYEDRPIGLRNLGSTCYLNSLIQALLNLDTDIIGKGTFLSKIRDKMIKMKNERREYYIIREFLEKEGTEYTNDINEKLDDDINTQNDPSELLMSVFTPFAQYREKSSPTYMDGATYIRESTVLNFDITVDKSTIRETPDQNKTYTNLLAETRANWDEKKMAITDNEDPSPQIYEQSFGTVERTNRLPLGEQQMERNGFKIDKIFEWFKSGELDNNRVKWTKYVLAGDKYLCIEIERFKDMYQKNNTPIVGLSETLDCPIFGDFEIKKYDLKSVICHTGFLKGGHYRCYVKNKSGWWHTDDDTVSYIPQFEGTITDDMSQNGYILFYKIQTSAPATATAGPAPKEPAAAGPGGAAPVPPAGEEETAEAPSPEEAASEGPPTASSSPTTPAAGEEAPEEAASEDGAGAPGGAGAPKEPAAAGGPPTASSSPTTPAAPSAAPRPASAAPQPTAKKAPEEAAPSAAPRPASA